MAGNISEGKGTFCDLGWIISEIFLHFEFYTLETVWQRDCFISILPSDSLNEGQKLTEH